MMTPEEKAAELTNRYYNQMNLHAPDCNISIRQAKQCALIAVDELMIEEQLRYDREGNYWLSVKEALLKPNILTDIF